MPKKPRPKSKPKKLHAPTIRKRKKTMTEKKHEAPEDEEIEGEDEPVIVPDTPAEPEEPASEAPKSESTGAWGRDKE